jgi:hypothetical protein
VAKQAGSGDFADLMDDVRKKNLNQFFQFFSFNQPAEQDPIYPEDFGY